MSKSTANEVEEVEATTPVPPRNPVQEVIDAEKERERVELERLVQEAEEAEVRLLTDRKKSPAGVHAELYVKQDERELLIKELVPEALPKHDPNRKSGQPVAPVFRPGATMEVAFEPLGDNGIRRRAMVRKGYIPVVKDGKHVEQGGDLMYKRDIIFIRDRFKSTHAQDEDRLSSTLPKAGSKDADAGFISTTSHDGLHVGEGESDIDRNTDEE